jgi:polyadenylate-binding protein
MVTEPELAELFTQVGPVSSVKICRDVQTRQSLRYGYVNFAEPRDAERALEVMNYHALRERPLRLMWSNRDPSVRRSGVGNVFINKLEKSIDSQTLFDTFSRFGNILSCKVCLDPQNGQSLGYGYIHFETEEDAKRSIEQANGKLLKEEKVFVSKFIPRTQRHQYNLTNFTNVYVKDLKDTVDDEQLKTVMSKFGTIKHHQLCKDGNGRPYAYINFETHEAALKAVEETNDQEVEGLSAEGVKLTVQRHQRKAERQAELSKKYQYMKQQRVNSTTGCNLFVKNLDDTIDDKALREAFAKHGDITSAKVQLDERTKTSKGFGFVCFRDPANASKAMEAMNNKVLGSKPLFVGVHQRREMRREVLQMQYTARQASKMSSAMGQMGQQGQMQTNMGQMQMYNQMYPGMPQQMYPGLQQQRAGMVPQGRWPQQGQPGMSYPQQGYPAMPFPGQVPHMQGGRGGRGQAQAGRGGRGGPQQQGAAQAGRGQYPVAGRGVAPPGKMGGNIAVPGRGYVTADQAMQMAQMGQQVPQQAAASVGGNLSLQNLMGMTEEQRKNALGEKLFELIKPEHDPKRASKITGMLLEMDVAETLNLLESPDVLKEKVNEALEVLQAHEQKAAGLA